jgi:hypothetical protein
MTKVMRVLRVMRVGKAVGEVVWGAERGAGEVGEERGGGDIRFRICSVTTTRRRRRARTARARTTRARTA